MNKTPIWVIIIFMILTIMCNLHSQRHLDASISIKPGSENQVLVSIYTRREIINGYPLADLQVKKGIYHTGEIDASLLAPHAIDGSPCVFIEISFERMYLLDLWSPHSMIIDRSDHFVLGCTRIIRIPINELGCIRYRSTAVSLSEIIIYVLGIILIIISIILLLFRRFLISLIVVSLEAPLILMLAVIKLWQLG